MNRTGTPPFTGLPTRLARRAARSGPARRLARTGPVRRALALPRIGRLVVGLRSGTGAPTLPVRRRPGPDITTRFVVLTTGRSGSTLLVKELDRRWNGVRCSGEAFKLGRFDGATVEEIIERVYFPARGPSIVGCKIFLHHVGPIALARILALPGMRVVILRRQNGLRQYVSERIASRDGVWSLGAGADRRAIAERTMAVNPWRFITWLRATDRVFACYDELTAGLPVLRISYEELAADLDGTVRRVGAFLGAGEPDTGGPPVLQRQNPEPLSVLVPNYREVSEFLRRRGLGHLLDDDTPGEGDTVPQACDPAAPCWPTTQQETLLHLALDPPGREIELAEAWFAAVSYRLLDPGSRRLLPLAYRRLRAAGFDDNRLDVLHRPQIDLRVDGLRALHALTEAVATLGTAGIDSLVLDAAALALCHVVAAGDRPFDRIEVAVPVGRLAAASDAMYRAGWDAAPWGRAEPPDRGPAGPAMTGLVRNGIALRLRDAGLAGMSGHAGLAGMAAGALDAELWAGAVAVEVGGRSARVLAPGDQLLRTLVTSLRWDGEDDIAWVADAHLLITSAGAQLDWERLADLSGRHGLGAPLVAGIDYLERTFPGLVPAEALAAVAQVPVTAAEHRAFAARLQPPEPPRDAR